MIKIKKIKYIFALQRVIMLFKQNSDNSDDKMINEAMRAGVSAYVIDGMSAKRVKPVLDVAIARFKEFQALRDELA